MSAGLGLVSLCNVFVFDFKSAVLRFLKWLCYLFEVAEDIRTVRKYITTVLTRFGITETENTRPSYNQLRINNDLASADEHVRQEFSADSSYLICYFGWNTAFTWRIHFPAISGVVAGEFFLLIQLCAN